MIVSPESGAPLPGDEPPGQMPALQPPAGREREGPAGLNDLVRLRQELSDQYAQCLRELRDDEHIAIDEDCSAECQSDGLLASTMEHLAGEIRKVDATLARIYDGSYGKCTECGKPIPEKRLRVNPTAQRCITCQRHAEMKR